MTPLTRLGARMRYRILRSPAAALVKSARALPRRSAMARRAALARGLPRCGEAVAAARKLEHDGFVRLDNLVDRDLLDALAARAQERVDADETTELPLGVSNKAFWTRPLDCDLIDGLIPADTVFARFALQPRILGVLAETLRTLPLLDYVLLTVSRANAGALSQSQLWHRDHDDVRTIKLFVYLTDVASANDGPFTFLPGPRSDRVGGSVRSHASDCWLFSRVDRSDLERILAKRLSVFAVETSRCLHMGSRVAPGHGRVLYTATYTTAPRIFGDGSRFAPAPGADETVRAVLGQQWT
ncbi:hypothetical protein [Qipengyuania nanhaisediminis]|uniref:hypothetical protein n=1 Tax=Qipengyuania nanhaisediminis TaxID=604088 RepID=UPI0038B3FD38